MRFFIALGLLMVSLSAHAQYNSGSMSFSVGAGDPSCAKISYISTSGSFPHLDKGDVTEVRFYYSMVDSDHVTENSPFQETQLAQAENGDYTVAPDEFCGLTPGTYYFKYGLVDTNDNILEFQSDTDSYSNSVEIAPVKP